MSQTAVGFDQASVVASATVIIRPLGQRRSSLDASDLGFGSWTASKAAEFWNYRHDHLRLVVSGYFRCVDRLSSISFRFSRRGCATDLKSGVLVGSPEKPRSDRSRRPLRKRRTAVKTAIDPLSWRYGPEKWRRWWQTKTIWNRVLRPVGRCYIRFPKTRENKYVASCKQRFDRDVFSAG